MRLPIPTDWDGESWCRWSVCWPDSQLWRIVLSGLVTSPIKGRLWDERTGSVTGAQAIGRLILERNLPLEECIMTCSDVSQLGIDIRYLADKLAGSCGSGCSNGTAGAGQVDDSASEADTGTPGNHTGDVPSGFLSWEEYDAYKCSVAHFIVDQLINDLQNTSSGSFIGATSLSAVLAILAFTMATPIPGDELVVIAGIVLAATASGVISQVTSDAATSLGEINDDLVCDLYMSSSTDNSHTAIMADITAKLEADLSSLAAGYATSVVDHMLSNISLNRLYERDTKRSYPAAVCDCGGDCLSAIVVVEDGKGVVVSGSVSSPGTLVINSEEYGGNNRVDLAFSAGELTCVMTIVDIQPSYSLEESGFPIYRLFTCGANIWSSNTKPDPSLENPMDVSAISVVAADPFQLTLEISAMGIGC